MHRIACRRPMFEVLVPPITPSLPRMPLVLNSYVNLIAIAARVTYSLLAAVLGRLHCRLTSHLFSRSL